MCVSVCVTEYSIISPVGDDGSCGHKPTWNLLKEGLVFTGTFTVLKEVSLFSYYNVTTKFRNIGEAGPRC